MHFGTKKLLITQNTYFSLRITKQLMFLDEVKHLMQIEEKIMSNTQVRNVRVEARTDEG